MRIAGLAVALLLFGGAACSGPAWTTLTGRVYSPNKYYCPPAAPCARAMQTVSGVPITAVSQPDRERFNTRTNHDGHFTLNLPGGDFDLYAANVKVARVTMVGYPAEKRYIELVLPYRVPLAAPHG